MSKILDRLRGFFRAKQIQAPKIELKSAKGCACYVLITCNEPGESGDMQVEMTCEGDENLIEYLVANVQNFFKDQESQNQNSQATENQ